MMIGNASSRKSDTKTATSEHQQQKQEPDHFLSRYKRLRTPHGRMPRQWLYDRCDGKSQPDTQTRPPTRACWPPFIIKYAPDLLEQNCCCEAVGRFGCCGIRGDERARARKRILWVCLVTNIVGLLFLILASLAISQDVFGLVWNFSFTSVWLEIVKGSTDATKSFEGPTFFGVGLRAAAYRAILTRNDTEVIIPFASFCDLSSPQSEAYDTVRAFVATATVAGTGCGNCEQMSKRIVPSLFLSMLGYIPNFTTDVLRMYANYDVNCQKVMASVFSWISLSTAIYTWVNYHRNCFSYADNGPIALNKEWQPVTSDSEDAYLLVHTRYRPGLGEICLALASLLKIVDIICNIMLPTPSITRDHEEQAEYEWKYGPAAAAVGEDSNEEGNIYEEQEVEEIVGIDFENQGDSRLYTE